MIGQKQNLRHISTKQMQTRTNSILVTRGFPRFKQVTCFYLKFSMANDDVNLCYDW